MGFRFRRTIKIAPGVRLNFSKSGVSTSIGGRGATVNYSKRGTRTTVSIPGTGISYSTSFKKSPSSSAPSPPSYNTPSAALAQPAPTGGKISKTGWIVAFVLCVVALYRCAGTTAPPKTEKRTAYVQASALNCRTEASAGAPVLRVLQQSQTVQVREERDGWSRLLSPPCWVASGHLSGSLSPN